MMQTETIRIASVEIYLHEIDRNCTNCASAALNRSISGKVLKILTLSFIAGNYSEVQAAEVEARVNRAIWQAFKNYIDCTIGAKNIALCPGLTDVIIYICVQIRLSIQTPGRPS